MSIDSVTTPITADPGSFVTLQGTISGTPVLLQPRLQRFFRIEASIVGSGITESIIFPDPDNFPANSPWPIQPNVPLTFTIPNFYIPPTSTGTVQVQIRVDPSNPDIVPESNQGNNSFNHNITITTGDPNIGATVFFDSRGTYQGLDPIKFKLVARNIGNGPIDAGQNFDLIVALSQTIDFQMTILYYGKLMSEGEEMLSGWVYAPMKRLLSIGYKCCLIIMREIFMLLFLKTELRHLYFPRLLLRLVCGLKIWLTYHQ